MKILIINGPNLNMLGIREPEKYGNETLADINEKIKSYCDANNINVEFYQSNIEGEIINKIHSAVPSDADRKKQSLGAYPRLCFFIMLN